MADSRARSQEPFRQWTVSLWGEVPRTGAAADLPYAQIRKRSTHAAPGRPASRNTVCLTTTNEHESPRISVCLFNALNSA